MEDYLLAGSADLSLADARRLSRHKSTRVRCKLAQNQKCPEVVLQKLAKDPDVEVRAALGQNPSTGERFLDQLILDSSETVRFSLAGNSKLGEQRLLILMEDSNPYVAERALTTYETIMLEEHLALLNLPQSEDRPLLGQLLLHAELISQRNLDFALNEGTKLQIPLGQVLLAKRMVARFVLAEALLIQSLVGLKRLTFEEGVYLLKRESRLDSTNIFRPKVMPILYQQHTC